MTEANRWAEKLKNNASQSLETLEGELGELQFFSLPVNACSAQNSIDVAK
jgi:hypothetical protein